MLYNGTLPMIIRGARPASPYIFWMNAIPRSAALLLYDACINSPLIPLFFHNNESIPARAMLASKYGFTDIQYALFYRERVFSAKEYIELLGTYSDHIAIDETIRTKFFSKIEDAINNHGGTITIYDTIDLQLARK